MKVVEYLYKKDSYVLTEEAMYSSLEDKSNISDDWTLHKLAVSTVINSLGLYGAQRLISSLDKQEKKIIVCQHVQVAKLKFDSNTIVCTPHATEHDSYISIPHTPENIGQLDIKDKKLFGFLGSTATHKTRKTLVKLYPEDCKATNVYWGLDLKNNTLFIDRYIENLASIHFSLCPRGTGISSVRLFESMAMGCIPVIIADGYRPPLSNILNWNDFSVRVKENNLRSLKQMLSEFSENDIASFKSKLNDVYATYFSIENFYKSVVLSENFNG